MSKPYLWLVLTVILAFSLRCASSKPVDVKVQVFHNRTTTTEIPVFDRNKISLAVPDALFGPTFQAANTVSSIIGNLMQNTALRIAALIEGLKPIFRISVGYHSKKREVFIEEENSGNGEDSEQNEITKEGDFEKSESPVRNSYSALTDAR